MKVYIYLVDTDNSCFDPECCGGPCPSLYVRAFSSIEEAEKTGIKKENLQEVKLDVPETTYISAN